MKIREFFKKAFRLISTGGISKEEMKYITPGASSANYRTWKAVSIASLVINALMAVVSFFVYEVAEVKYVYMAAALFFALVVTLLFTVVNEEKVKALSTLIFLSCAVAYASGILFGTMSSRDMPAVTFAVFLVALPILIIDRPYRIVVLNTLASAAFIIACLFYKTGEVLSIDIIDTAVFFVASIIIYLSVSRYKIKSLLEEYKTNQRIYIDALTGLANEYAYLRMADLIDGRIKNGDRKEFAVMMFDVNNVKATNDKYGHTFGCSLIVEGGHYIKSLFEGSLTFHVGGDEYIAILEGKDYKDRDRLIAEFDKKMETYTHTKDGIEMRLVIARGIAVYEPEADKTFRDVLNRADKAMYENKRAVKEKYNLPAR